MKQLTAQFPIRPLRIVYAASGTLPAACVVRCDRAVIDHKLYWAAPETEAEAHYLAAILNSETARRLAEKYQSGAPSVRAISTRSCSTCPSPASTPRTPQALAAAAAEAETLAATVPIPEGTRFQMARRRLRQAFGEAGIAQRIDTLVAQLLGAKRAGKARAADTQARVAIPHKSNRNLPQTIENTL